MTSTSPTPDGPSGKNPGAHHPAVPPTPLTSELQSLHPLTAPRRTETEPTTHRILGQRLVIDYQTTERGGREVLEFARVFLVPPFGSSALMSRPYTLQPHPEDSFFEPQLITLLHNSRDKATPPQDQEILNGLAALMRSVKGIKVLYDQTRGPRIRREIPQMTYVPPAWANLKDELRSLSSQYVCSRIQNGLYQECICKIDPKRNALTLTFFEADRSISAKTIDVVEACKSIPPGLSPTQAQERAWRDLKHLADNSMRIFLRYGPQCLIADLKNALPPGALVAEEKIPQSLDERLRLGIVCDYHPEKVVELPGGGRAILEVGDDVAALSIFSTTHEGCSSYSVVLDAQKLPDSALTWEHGLAQIRSLMDKLPTTSTVGQMLILQRLAQQASYEFDRRCGTSHLIGEQAAQLFSSLYEFDSVRLWLPNTASLERRHELVMGYERAEISLAHVPGASENLAAFSSVALLIGPNGSMDIQARNQLANRLKVSLSADCVTQWGGHGAVVSKLALALSTRSVNEAHIRVHQLFSKLVATDPTNSTISLSASKSDYPFPPNNSLDRKPFLLASDIAHTAHRFSRGFGDHRAAWIDESCAVAVVDYLFGPYFIHFETDENSITSVRFQGKAFYLVTSKEITSFPSLSFTIDERTSKLLLQSLPELLGDYAQLSEQLPDNAFQDVPIRETKLFDFLMCHGGQPPTIPCTPSE